MSNPDRVKKNVGPPAPCACCGKVGPITARGLRETCYSRILRYGNLEKFPLMRSPGQYALREESRSARDRAEKYRQLTSGPGALGRKKACIVLGIAERTAYRYEAWIRAQQGEEQSGQGS